MPPAPLSLARPVALWEQVAEGGRASERGEEKEIKGKAARFSERTPSLSLARHLSKSCGSATGRAREREGWGG